MRIALADDSTLFRTGLALMLAGAGIEVTAQVADGNELLATVAADEPDAVILDIRMPPTFTDEGIAVAQRLRQRHPGVAVLVLSTYAQTSYAVRLMGEVGRAGYLLKDRVEDLSMLADALQRVIRGEPVVDSEIVTRLLRRQVRHREIAELTEREREVLRLMAEGRSNAGIGRALHLAPKTVETHVSTVFTKLNLHAGAEENRRVLAVLVWLRATG